LKRLIQFIVSLLIAIFIGYGVNRYIYGIVVNIQKNQNDPDNLNNLLGRLPHQMYLLFTLGIAAACIIFLMYYFLNRYFLKNKY
jgi:H+/Cl- antiporter ClcA